MTHNYVRLDEVLEVFADCLTLEQFDKLTHLYSLKIPDDVVETSQPQVEMAVEFYDQSEIHHNCAVEVFSNSVTGDVSIGWWYEDGGDDEDYDEEDEYCD